MTGYNCKIEYILGTTNTFVDLSSRKQDDEVTGGPKILSEDEEVVLNIKGNTFVMNSFNSNGFEP